MKLILWILIAFGVIAIYDARKLTKKYFDKADQNKTVKILKWSGFVVCVVCGLILILAK